MENLDILNMAGSECRDLSLNCPHLYILKMKNPSVSDIYIMERIQKLLKIIAEQNWDHLSSSSLASFNKHMPVWWNFDRLSTNEQQWNLGLPAVQRLAERSANGNSKIFLLHCGLKEGACGCFVAVWQRENNMWGHKKRPKDAIKMIIFCSSATVLPPLCSDTR